MTKMGKDGDNKRISQTGDRPKEEIRSRMAEASAIVRSVLGSIQAVAGTTACKGVQIHALYKYAIEHGCWFYNLSEYGKYDLFDVLPNNVLMGVDGNLYFIDTIIYRSDADQENLKRYQSLSPRYKSKNF